MKEEEHMEPEGLYREPVPSAQSDAPRGMWKRAMRRFRKNRLAWLAWRFTLVLIFVAVFADFLANGKPIVASHNGTLYFPVLADYLEGVGLYEWTPEMRRADWRELELDFALWPPVRYSPDEGSLRHSALSPFEEQDVGSWKEWHFLGTDKDGRDTLAGLIHGTRLSLTVGLVAMCIAGFIGILLGVFAGFFGDDRIRMSRIRILCTAIGLFFGWFYGFQVRGFVLSDALNAGLDSLIPQFLLSVLILILITVLFSQLGRPLERIPFLGKKQYIWVDILISRIVEIVQALPSLLLIITVAAVVEKPSLYMVMVIIGVMGWPGISRYMRAEMLVVRNREYMQAARAMGFSSMRQMFMHALPNAIAPVLIIMAFGIAGAILSESTLSFLGIGVPDDAITWGSIIESGKGNVSMWWLNLFPGLAIFVTVTLFNLMGDGLRDALDPRIRDE